MKPCPLTNLDLGVRHSARTMLPAGSQFGFDLMLEGEHALFLDQLRLPDEAQKQGVGTKFLTMVIELADQAGLPVLLVADPTDRPGDPSTYDLVRFYDRLGFRAIALSSDEGVVMKRAPGAAIALTSSLTTDAFEALRAGLPDYLQSAGPSI